MKADELLDWAEFVATKFEITPESWRYSRNTGGLVHVRYKSDFTGYNHWAKRLRRAISNWNPVTYFRPKDNLNKMFQDRNPSIKGFFVRAGAWSLVELRKESNLPDGQVNGNLTFWEEDGQYIMLFSPLVGREVIKFLRAEPDSPYAQAIIEQMKVVVGDDDRG